VLLQIKYPAYLVRETWGFCWLGNNPRELVLLVVVSAVAYSIAKMIDLGSSCAIDQPESFIKDKLLGQYF